MGHALQTISGFVSPGAASTAVVTPSPGDTFQVPSFAIGSKARILDVYASGPTCDFVRIRSPRMHDANQGLRLSVGATKQRSLVSQQVSEVLYPSDTPIVETDGTGVGVTAILATYEFDDLDGVTPLLGMADDIAARTVHIMGCEVDVVAGAIGNWGASAALNANFDNFEAGVQYALLGYNTTVSVHGIAITGKDTGNLKIGGTGASDALVTSDYFMRLSKETGRPLVPIIQANNKAATVCQAVDIAAATATHVTLLLAQLG